MLKTSTLPHGEGGCSSHERHVAGKMGKLPLQSAVQVSDRGLRRGRQVKPGSVGLLVSQSEFSGISSNIPKTSLLRHSTRASDCSPMIPKKIHYVWVGPKPIPGGARRFIAGWRALNPDYEIIRWDESNIDFSSPFVRSAYAVGAWNRVANYARADVLLKHGGVYLDTDIELRRP